MRIDFSPPDISEDDIAEVADVLRSGWITTGPKTKLFEAEITEYCAAGGTVCMNSATAALELSLRLMGIGPGDEVITSAYTYSASASVIAHIGATPVLVDTAPGAYTMNPDGLEKSINTKTKAIIPVDVGGVPCETSVIFELLEQKRGLYTPNNEKQAALGRVLLLSDAAHSFGAERNGHKTGSLADFTCFSFHAVKNLTTAEGGCVLWRKDVPWDGDSLYREFMLLCLHGQNKDALQKATAGGWEYDIVAPYFKCNMTDIAAALGQSQLRKYPHMLTRRGELARIYDAAFQGTDVAVLEHCGEGFESSRHLYMLRVSGITETVRNEIIARLAGAGVAANVHYKPLPMLSAYKNMGFSIEDFPNAYDQYANEISIPLHTLLSDEDACYVAESLLNILGEMKV